jgi:hypothetical protein
LALQNSWLDWVKAGRPPLHPKLDDGALLASTPSAAPATSTGGREMVSVANPILRERSANAGKTAASPSPDDSAAITPTPRGVGGADWSTGPVRHTMNAATQQASRAVDRGAWR